MTSDQGKTENGQKQEPEPKPSESVAPRSRRSAASGALLTAAILAAGAVVGSNAPVGPSSVGSSVSAPTRGVERQQGMAVPQASSMSLRAQSIIPLVNVPFMRRRDAIWLGRVRDGTGTPMGSRNPRRPALRGRR